LISFHVSILGKNTPKTKLQMSLIKVKFHLIDGKDFCEIIIYRLADYIVILRKGQFPLDDLFHVQ